MSRILEELCAGNSLSSPAASSLMDAIFDGVVDDAQIAGLLTALRAKGETVDELFGLAQSMLARSTRITAPNGAIDIVGTGGDNKNSVNISTMASLVVAGAGVPVVKHGSRASSSNVGSADVLEALGVKIDSAALIVERCVEQANMGFCFAQSFHPAMKAVAPVRRSLKIRTVFNILGPLANPAQPDFLLLGVADKALLEPMAEVLGRNGVKHAWVLHSRDGFDELSISAPSDVFEVTRDRSGSFELAHFVVDPAIHGFAPTDESALDGGDVRENARIVQDLLEGGQGPITEMVVLNAAAGLMVAQRSDDLDQAIVLARYSLASGAAHDVLETLRMVSNES